jgi:hypothetical protein
MAVVVEKGKTNCSKLNLLDGDMGKVINIMDNIMDDHDKKIIRQRSDMSFAIVSDSDANIDSNIENNIDISNLCRDLGMDCDEMQKFINSVPDFNRDIMTNFSKLNDNDVHLSRYSAICALSLFKRISSIKTNCDTYQRKFDIHGSKMNLYGSSSHNNHFESDKANDIVDVSQMCNDVLSNVKGLDDIKLNELMNRVMTRDNKIHEITKCKLMYYSPSIRLNMRNSNMDEVSIIIKNELDCISSVARAYLEDDEWKINNQRELNFKVPESKIVFSNTVRGDKFDNEYLLMYLDMIMKYLERFTNSRSIKYRIVEDNKYDIHWVLIALSIKSI